VSRSSSSRRFAVACAVALAATLAALVSPPAARSDADPPWRLAAGLRDGLARAEGALILGDRREARQLVRQAAPRVERLARLLPESPLERAFGESRAAVLSGDEVRLAAARAGLHTAILAGAYRAVLASIEDGNAAAASRWLLVREFRPPTRFSRPGADATLAVASLSDGRATVQEALAAVRADYLDTYQARLRGALEAGAEAVERGFASRLAAESALALGYFSILEESFRRQRGTAAADRVGADLDRLLAAALARDFDGADRARTDVESALEGFRAAPLSGEEEIRRAGQFLRFLALVPVEYGRGVADGKVTLAFEIQEAVTFRDGAAQAFADLEGKLAERDTAATSRIDDLVTALGEELAAASEGRSVAPEEAIAAKADEALDLAEGSSPTSGETPARPRTSM
jgi:high-affinity iron transporter